MKLGLCGSMVVPSLEYGGIEVIDTLARLGYDYIELSISHLAALPDSEFARVKKRIADTGVPCESCNNFFPRDVRLTGPEVDYRRIKQHVEKALGKAAELGAEIVVFGSGQAKTIPGGFPKGEAILQLIEICNIIAPIADSNGITIALEPLNKLECNIINTAFEAMQLAKTVESKHIQILIDYYHLVLEKESPLIIPAAKKHIKHVHFARPKGRAFPAEIGEDKGYIPFFENLKKIKYKGRISVEAFSDDFENDAAKSIRFLRYIIEEYKF